MSKKALLDARAALKDLKAKRLAATAGAANRKPGFGASSKAIPEIAKKMLSKFGAKTFDDLMTVNTAEKKFAYIPKEERDQIKALKESVDIAVLCGKIFNKPVKETKYFQEEVDFQLKALGIVSGESGYEWIPTMVSDSYIDEFNLDRKVAGLFTEVKMPSNPYKWPVLTGGAIARQVGEVTALGTPQSFTTNKTIQFDAVKLTNQYALPEELAEDSAPDVIKVIRQELIEGQEKAVEIAILEGDADGTPQHNFTQLPDVAGTPTVASLSDTPEKSFDGLRKRALAAGALGTVDCGANPVSETEMSSARGKMGKFGVDPSQLAIIAGPKVYNELLQLDDVRTLQQYGTNATVITGELAKYEGIPVIVSEYLREDTAAAGVNVATVIQNIKGSLIIVNRKRFFVGTRRGIQVRVENNRTQYDVLDMVSFARKAFQGVLKSDGSNYAQESSVALIYNIGL